MKQIQGGVTAPKGFTAGGVRCGVKQSKGEGNQPLLANMSVADYLSGKKDLALILSERECNAAATYVSAGLGVCILPRTPLHTKYRAVAIPIAYPARSRNICLLYNKSHPMSGSARRFHDFVLSRFPAFHGDQYD